MQKSDKYFLIFLTVIGMILLSLLCVFILAWTRYSSVEDWYLVCSGKDSKDYLVKSETKPVINGGFIVVDGNTFITPEAGMTCKPIMGNVVRDAINNQSPSEVK